MAKIALPATSERVKLHTNREVNERIRKMTEANIVLYREKDKEQVAKRMQELDKEWDIERALETSASSFVIVGTALGFILGPGWFLVTGIVGVFLLQHALEGWCPPLPVFRRMGMRTAAEINEEKTALKQIREGTYPDDSGSKL